MYTRTLRRSSALSALCGMWLAVGSLWAAPTQQYNSGDPSGDEQYVLELINRARMGPVQEGVFLTTQTETNIVSAYSFFGVSKPLVVSQFSVIPQAQPLAMSQYLLATARAQSADMKQFHYQGHVNHAGQDLQERVAGTSYAPLSGGLPLAALAENVYAPIGAPINTLLYGQVGLNIDWGVPDLSHRKAIMGLNDLPTFDYGTLREVGVGLTRNPNSGGQPLSWYITQDFGVIYDTSSGSFGPSTTPFLVGVVYTDSDSDGFYTPGEGASGITVMPDVGDCFAVTATAGGYAFPLKNLPVGTTSINLTFSGGPLGTRQIKRKVALNGTKNIKADVVLVADPTTRLGNISTRLRFETGANVGIVGITVTGPSPKNVLIRGIGPSLAQFGISGTMSNPTLNVYNAAQQVIASNDDWQVPASNGQDVASTNQQPGDARESAVVLHDLPPGQYTAIISGVGGEVGVGRIDAIDLDASSTATRTTNLSTRGHVLTDPSAMIAGFVINGTQKRRVAIRAIGPSLAQFIPGTLGATTFQVFGSASSTVPIATNTGWKNGNVPSNGTATPSGGSMAELQTHSLAPGSTNESALVMTLSPGAYTVVVRGVSATTGVGLVEVYDLEE